MWVKPEDIPDEYKYTKRGISDEYNKFQSRIFKTDDRDRKEEWKGDKTLFL